MNFARALRVARAAVGKQQKEIADLAGIKQSYLSLLESGKRTNPGLETISNISKALGVHQDVLMALSSNESLDQIRIGWAILELYKNS
jgi:transcriptional regulator with XRE-family HTH domain